MLIDGDPSAKQVPVIPIEVGPNRVGLGGNRGCLRVDYQRI